jgi:hypothetical protein
LDDCRNQHVLNTSTTAGQQLKEGLLRSGSTGSRVPFSPGIPVPSKGIEFIDENGGGAGVRLRKAKWKAK